MHAVAVIVVRTSALGQRGITTHPISRKRVDLLLAVLLALLELCRVFRELVHRQGLRGQLERTIEADARCPGSSRGPARSADPQTDAVRTSIWKHMVDTGDALLVRESRGRRYSQGARCETVCEPQTAVARDFARVLQMQMTQGSRNDPRRDLPRAIGRTPRARA